jgi:N-acyl-D-aspartate/D-glutamate deacylase
MIFRDMTIQRVHNSLRPCFLDVHTHDFTQSLSSTNKVPKSAGLRIV